MKEPTKEAWNVFLKDIQTMEPSARITEFAESALRNESTEDLLPAIDEVFDLAKKNNWGTPKLVAILWAVLLGVDSVVTKTALEEALEKST